MRLSHLYGVRPEWLEYGVGPMKRADDFPELPSGETWREIALRTAASSPDRTFLEAFVQLVDAIYRSCRSGRTVVV